MLARLEGLVRLESGTGWLKCILPAGELSIATTERLLPEPSTPYDCEASWGIRLEPIEEILARKLRLRMYGNGEFVARDFYDLCTATEEAPAALHMALAVLTPKMRNEIADEIKSLGQQASHKGRTLIGVHHPEWLDALAKKTSSIIGEWP